MIARTVLMSSFLKLSFIVLMTTSYGLPISPIQSRASSDTSPARTSSSSSHYSVGDDGGGISISYQQSREQNRPASPLMPPIWGPVGHPDLSMVNSDRPVDEVVEPTSQIYGQRKLDKALAAQARPHKLAIPSDVRPHDHAENSILSTRRGKEIAIESSPSPSSSSSDSTTFVPFMGTASTSSSIRLNDAGTRRKQKSLTSFFKAAFRGSRHRKHIIG